MFNRQTILRSIGAVLFALALWVVVMLSGVYVITVDVPLKIELPSNRALAQPLPSYVETTIRARGWSLIKVLVLSQNVCLIRPALMNSSQDQMVTLREANILANIRTTVSDAQQVNVAPDSLAFTVSPIASKRVPVTPVVYIGTQPGFDMIGSLRVSPDSITLYGAPAVLNRINSWKTQTLSLLNVHSSIHRTLTFADTLSGIVQPQQNSVSIDAEIQEIAEKQFYELPVHVRTLGAGNGLSLALLTPIIRVTVRGGVRDLANLKRSDITVEAELRYNADTLGKKLPTISLPPNFSIVSIEPKYLRYLWKQEL